MPAPANAPLECTCPSPQCAGNATSGDSVLDLLSRRSDLTVLFRAALAAGDEFVKTLNGAG